MKILVEEDHSIPNAAMYIFYRIGSRNERPGTTVNGLKQHGCAADLEPRYRRSSVIPANRRDAETRRVR